MLNILISLVSGLLFGIGLIISGMSNPQKVIGFLNIFADWDPSLIFVMLGGIGISFFPFQWSKHQQKSLLGYKMNKPEKNKIDLQLIAGSALFGIGWGLVGICPGPAIVLLGRGLDEAVYFVLSMLIGMLLVSIWKAKD
jgi:uncharacterized membrane protein YedE/YeeE